jgi:hypothetical protein
VKSTNALVGRPFMSLIPKISASGNPTFTSTARLGETGASGSACVID